MDHTSIKAVYNSLLFCVLDEKSRAMSGAEEWKTCLWREESIESLFQKLTTLDIAIDRQMFLLWAEDVDSPEELLLLLAPEASEAPSQEEREFFDHLYLILFELWRKLIPEKRSLSIVADDLDWAIFDYDTVAPDTDEEEFLELYDALVQLLFEYVRILQATCDEMEEGGHTETSRTEEIFTVSQPFFAHDIGRFIPEFFLEELCEDNAAELAPLVEAFLPFISPKSLALALQAHLIWYDDEERGCALARRLVQDISLGIQQGRYDSVKETDALLGALGLAAKSGDKALFQMVIRVFLDMSKSMSPEVLFELMSLVSIYAEVIRHPLLSQLIAFSEDVEVSYTDISVKEYPEIERSAKALLRRTLSV